MEIDLFDNIEVVLLFMNVRDDSLDLVSIVVFMGV